MASTSGGQITWDLDVDDQKLKKGLSDAGAVVDKAAKDTEKKFSSMAENISTSFEKASKSLTSAGTAMIQLGAAPAAALGLSVKRAMDFESTMADISTLISGDSTKAMAELSDEVLQLSKRMPKSIDELGGSLYDILSAGVQGSANQMLVLKESAKLATAGLGDTKGATDIMTSSINAFGLEASDSARISDILFKTVKFGKTTVDQMAMSFGATAPIVAAAGISLEEFSAATAALTTTGLPASQAQNSLRQAVVALQKPTADMSELFAKAGITSGEAALKQFGLVGTMEKVTKAAGGNSEMLAKAWGSVEALGSSTALTDQVSQAFTDTLKDMTGGADAIGEAFEKQKATTASQMIIMRNNLDALAITIGSAVLPALNKLLKAVLPIIQKIATFAEENPKLTATILAVGAGIAALGVVFVVLGTIIGAVGTVMGALAPIAAIVGVAVGAISLPVLLIIGAIAALIAIGVLLYKNWDTIQAKARSLWSQITSVISGAINSAKLAVQNAVQGMWNYIQNTWNSIVGFLSGMGGRIIDAITKPFRDAKDRISRIAQQIRDAANRINPFHRESPSLVDNVRRGIGIIQDEFSSLGNMKMPSLSVGAGFDDPMMATVGGGGGDTNTTNSSQNVTINNYIDEIRDRSDIDALNRQMGFQLSIR